MNEVMCLAEDIGIKIFYQDTDSMHLPSEDVPKLENKFKEIYNRDLNGKNMGQFHTDFDSDILKGNIYSKCFIALGKKCYLDVLTDKPNKKTKSSEFVKENPDYKFGKEDYHIRMKGVSNDAIKYKASRIAEINNIPLREALETLYKRLFD